MIHEIENLLRKLLTKFAFTKLEKNWHTEIVPDDVRSNIDKKQNKLENDAQYLYQTDFIHLANILSGKVKIPDLSQLQNHVSKAKNVEDLDFAFLKKYVPSNNWDKYFSEVVNLDWNDFKINWENLYLLRCKVAHNNFLNQQDYENIVRLTDKFKGPIQEAIQKLDTINISPEDQEALRIEFENEPKENINKVFIQFYRMMEVLLGELGYFTPNYKIQKQSVMSLANLLHKHSIIPIDFVRSIEGFYLSFYQIHVESIEVSISELRQLEDLVNNLRSIKLKKLNFDLKLN